MWHVAVWWCGDVAVWRCGRVVLGVWWLALNHLGKHEEYQIENEEEVEC